LVDGAQAATPNGEWGDGGLRVPPDERRSVSYRPLVRGPGWRPEAV